MRDAACMTCEDARIFFEEDRPTMVRAARKICSVCPVNNVCLQHALQNKEVGVWGGTTTNQRAKMLRVKRFAATRRIVAE